MAEHATHTDTTVVTGTQSEEMAGGGFYTRWPRRSTLSQSGILPEYWSTLSRLDIPTLLVVGETDSKYRLLATRMSKSLPKAEELIIASAGHAHISTRNDRSGHQFIH